MGRIKSTLVKRTAEKLLAEMPESFTHEFERNKKVLGASMPSKRIRNMLAGYLSRIKMNLQSKQQV